MFRVIRLALAFALAVAGAAASVHAADEPPLVFAAASLKDALDEVADRYRAETGRDVVLSYAGTPALARQIENGAPADLFVSADREWMDHLADRDLIRPATRRDLLGNRLVLVAPAGTDIAAGPDDLSAVRAALGADGRLAIAETESVPAGRYARAALENSGLWKVVSDRLAAAENVRAALAFVARGEAPLGVVYRTDAAAEPRVKVLATFAEDSHPPIVYPAALLSASSRSGAVAFLAFLGSESAETIFRRHGFAILR